MPEITFNQLRVDLDEATDMPTALRARLASKYGLSTESLSSLRVVRRALDARGRGPPRFWVTVSLCLPEGEAIPTDARALPEAPPPTTPRVHPPKRPPVIVGSGPAGLFCALELAKAGVPSVILERGAKVEHRKHDVAALYRRGELDPESNVCFGEGGAGTFTDGKLSTRVRDPAVREVLQILVDHGADPQILVSSKPHIGSERLPAIVTRVREHLDAQGCTLRFRTRVDALDLEGDTVRGLRLSDGERVTADRVVLAVGGSARELFFHLARFPGVVQPKAFAVGLRVEHPQALVNAAQYGKWAEHPALPAADYKLAARADPGTGGRGVWAFCMCPGGVVVPTPTAAGALCVNGMSGSRRSGRFANSALVVEVRLDDLAAFGQGDARDDPLVGLRFQETLERSAFAAGDEAYAAPSSSLRAFLEGGDALAPGRSSYPRGLVPAELGALFPRPLERAMQQATRTFARRLRGFDAPEARLIGVETRTSSPVTLPRGADTASLVIKGLHPCGEGCGHAGGIVSAAIDGLRVARALLARMPSRD